MATLGLPPGVDMAALMKIVADAEAEGGMAQQDVEAARAATEADDQERFEEELARENRMLSDAALGKTEGTPCAKCGIGGAKKLCGRCRQVSYCSQECQKQHWKRHKKQCRAPSAGAKDSEPLSATELASAMAALQHTGQQSAAGVSVALLLSHSLLHTKRWLRPCGAGAGSGSPNAPPSASGKDIGPPLPNAFRECAELFVRQLMVARVRGVYFPVVYLTATHHWHSLLCDVCARSVDSQCKDLGLSFDPLTAEDCEPVGVAGLGAVAIGDGQLGDGAEAALDAAMAKAMLDEDGGGGGGGGSDR